MLRSMHDRELAELKRLLNFAEQARADAHQQALDAMRLHELERRRYDDLLTRYTDLRMTGANPKADAPPPIAKREPDPVTQAIISRAGNNALLRKHYFDYVNQQRSQQVEDATIAANILAGETLDPAEDGVLG